MKDETGSSFNHPGEFWKAFQSKCEELVAKNSIAVDQLTQKQIAEALTQAIACGDFVRYLRFDNQGQTIVYLPFEREQQLQRRISQLEAVLAQFRYEVARLRMEKPPNGPWDTLEYFLRDPAEPSNTTQDDPAAGCQD